MKTSRPNPLELLARASQTLFSSLNYDETLAALAKLIVPALAEWCGVDVLEHGRLRRVHVAHRMPEKEALAKELDRRYPPVYSPMFGPGKVVSTLEPDVVNGIPDEIVRAAAADEDHYRALKQFDLAAFLCVPMVANGRPVGVLSLLRNSREGYFDAEDIEIARELALRAAIAVHNAQVTQELQSSDLRLRLAQKAGRIGTWEIDLITGEVIWSDELYDIVGFDRDVAADFSYYMDRIHPDDKAATNNNLREQLSSSSNETSWEYRMIGEDGRIRWVATRGMIIRDKDARPQKMVGVIMDITERKFTEAALLESERLAVAGRLAATLAHEINNPLAAITNLVYLSRNAGSLPEAWRYLDLAEQELRRVSQVTSQTLRYYKDDSGVGCDLCDLVESTLLVLRRKLEAKNVRLRSEISDDSKIHAREAEGRQIMLNLLANAIDAVEENGTIRIRSYTQGEEVRLIVSDNGIGIPHTVAPRLFQPFVTSKGTHGTGLGLWISKSLIEKNGGSLKVRSSRAWRRGTTFRVTLPRWAADAQKTGAQRLAAPV